MHFANSSFGFQFIDSDEDNDGYVDTDEEVSNGRLNLLNGSGPPYFHGYLYMKSKKRLVLFVVLTCKWLMLVGMLGVSMSKICICSIFSPL